MTLDLHIRDSVETSDSQDIQHAAVGDTLTCYDVKTTSYLGGSFDISQGSLIEVI